RSFANACAHQSTATRKQTTPEAQVHNKQPTHLTVILVDKMVAAFVEHSLDRRPVVADGQLLHSRSTGCVASWRTVAAGVFTMSPVVRRRARASAAAFSVPPV